MPTEYENLVTAMKTLTKGEEPDTVTLPVAENGWNTRPDADSYGVVALDFEAYALHGDDRKVAVAYDGSDYRAMTIGFPLESITDTDFRRRLLSNIITFLIR